MKPAPFAYHRARTLSDALETLARHGNEARPIAGGQSLAPMLNMRIAQPELLVDLNGLGGLAEIKDEGDTIAVGALARHHDVERDPLIRRAVPLLAQAAGTIGHYAIRQRGTIGGSLSHADPAAQLPAVALALGAEMEIATPTGTRREPAASFFVSTFETSLQPGEILTAIHFPVTRAGEGWGFHLFSRRPGDYAIALAAARCSGDQIDLAFAGVSATPVGRRLSLGAEADWVASVAHAEASALDIEDAPRVPAAFRREIAAVVAERALRDAVQHVRGARA